MSSTPYYSYIRVSTIRQGQTGTSLTEQRAAINRYAERCGFTVVQEFEEKETAAKQGRPVFGLMLKGLKQGKARGVIIHKIDRSARNLKDWANLGELIDQGIEVHFANESLDLQSRGGRLSADIQAVVAADYIRNLKEETKKGFYGRIKQGLYPRPAPIGYLDTGKGQPKALDPIRAPLIKQAFDLYATGQWPMNALIPKLYDVGLRTRQDKKLTLNGLSTMLHNPFYAGLIQIKTRGELFPGAHQPLVSKKLFGRVQDILAGKTVEKRLRHTMLFRKLIRCSHCGSILIGEKQKGNIYYRCHTKECPQKTIREDIVEEQFVLVLQHLRFSEFENQYLRQKIKEQHHDYLKLRESQQQALRLQLDQLQARLAKLTDTLIDGLIEKETYLQRKNRLVLEEQGIKEQFKTLDNTQDQVTKRIERFLELANSAYTSYKLANYDEKRELVKIITSNSTINGKCLLFKLNLPFQILFERQKLRCGSAERSEDRTLLALLSQLTEYFKDHELYAKEESVASSPPLESVILESTQKMASQTKPF
jgi:site-specific DNA recombinase